MTVGKGGGGRVYISHTERMTVGKEGGGESTYLIQSG